MNLLEQVDNSSADLTDLWQPTQALRQTWPRSGEKGELFEFALSGYPHARDFFTTLLRSQRFSAKSLERLSRLGLNLKETK